MEKQKITDLLEKHYCPLKGEEKNSPRFKMARSWVYADLKKGVFQSAEKNGRFWVVDEAEFLKLGKRKNGGYLIEPIDIDTPKNQNSYASNKPKSKTNTNGFPLFYFSLILGASVWVGIALLAADSGSLFTPIMLVILLIASPVIGFFVTAHRSLEDENSRDAKALGWGAFIVVAGLSLTLLKSDFLEPARDATKKLHNEMYRSDSDKQIKNLGNAAGQYFDKNCAQTSTGC